MSREVDDYLKRKAERQFIKDQNDQPEKDAKAAREQKIKDLKDELRLRLLQDKRYIAIVETLNRADFKMALEDIVEMWNIHSGHSVHFQDSPSTTYYYARPKGYVSSSRRDGGYGSSEYKCSIPITVTLPNDDAYVEKNYTLSPEEEQKVRNIFLEKGGELQLILDKTPILRLVVASVGGVLAFHLLVGSISEFDQNDKRGFLPTLQDGTQLSKKSGTRRVFTDSVELLDVLIEAIVTEDKNILGDEYFRYQDHDNDSYIVSDDKTFDY